MARPANPNSAKPVQILIGVKPESAVWLDTFADEHGLYRTEVVKVCLAVAKRHAAEVAAGCAQLSAFKKSEKTDSIINER